MLGQSLITLLLCHLPQPHSLQMFQLADGQSSVESFHTARSHAEDDLRPGSEEQVRQAIQNIADPILRVMPLRLLNTDDGKIYAHPGLITKLGELSIFHSLLTLPTTRSTLKQKQKEYFEEEAKIFFEYAMLSHRWEGDEPGFRDIPQEGVYTLSTPRFDKVRNFCRKARKCGFLWAWIDTCCIDQSNSAEVQKSIASMFSWYRGSALTIIYLSDVAESSDQELLLSQWFRRGWTLQELLAAKVIQLYKRDWTPFSQSAESNHKNVPEILDALESATGIQKAYLIFYCPSAEHPRMKLRWARDRVTKEKEDEAYCLMGIFGFTMPVSYGEGDRAFARLLMEIMKHTRDHDATLLDWIGQPSTLNSCLPSSPICFSEDPFATTEMSLGGLPRPVLSFASAAKLVFVFKRAVSRARNSSRLDNGHNTTQELSGDGPDDDGAPQIARTASSQNFFSLKRSASLPFGEILPLARLLEKPLGPYRLNPEYHITVPCFLHEVLSLYFAPEKGSYYCRANGIKSFSLVTSEILKTSATDHSFPSRYLLVRNWDPRLSYESSHLYRTSMPLLRERLKNPFFAMLLERGHDDRFRRISTSKRIVAQLELLPPQTYGVQSIDLL